MMILNVLFLGLGACLIAPQSTTAQLSTTAQSLTSTVHSPNYLVIRENVEKVSALLRKKVLSMADHVPWLSDSRRHYAEIVNVLYSEAVGQSGCVLEDYNKHYQEILDKSAGEALSNPEAVIQNTAKFLEEFNDKTFILQLIIKDRCRPKLHPVNCNTAVTALVAENKPLLDNEVEIYVAAGKAAEEYLKLADEFAAVSEAHDALKYVIEGAGKLEKVAKALGDVLRKNRYDSIKC